jgi:maltose O-acetyltransferase
MVANFQSSARPPARLQRFLTHLLNEVCASPLLPHSLRQRALPLLRIDAGGAFVGTACRFRFPANVRIGAGSWINDRCTFENDAPIHIGARCYVGMEVMFCTATHALGDGLQRAGSGQCAPITVEDGCWIGARAVILAGTTVGSGAVVAAGAVVVDDCLPNHLYAGVPARSIRSL